MTDLSNVLAHLPSDAGVYQMIDQGGTVLYVGKAKNLKKRVTSYFNKQQGVKTRSLVSQIVHIEISVTRTETEALLLESNLIKSLRPKYNILMRDDKTYPYLYVNQQHRFPRIEMVRSKKKPNKGLYFGPYPSVAAVRETLTIIQKVFKIRNCRDTYFNTRMRPCLQYQIKRCSAPCTQYISEQSYQSAIEAAIKFLQGKCSAIIDELSQKMEQAVSNLRYEEAALLRDQIKSLRLIQEQQGMMRLNGEADVIAIQAGLDFACVQCISIRDGSVLSNQRFFPILPPTESEITPDFLLEQVFEAFVNFYYLEAPGRIPDEIILANAIQDYAPIAALLSDFAEKKCRIVVKPRGDKSRWVDFAVDNLKLSVSEHRSLLASRVQRYESLALLLGLEQPIRHMECFDISHTQGQQTVASCVVFDHQGPNKKEYRHFNILDITPGDDYQAMEQVLRRRFKRLVEEQTFPDLLIIDGGKGQVKIAQAVLERLQVPKTHIIGIAKGVDRKAGWERLIIADENREITVDPDLPGLHLLQHIRDEAHRFAIKAHRQKRHKTGLSSSLDQVEGIGPKRRYALLQRFGGIRDLAQASIEEIAKVGGVSQALAQRIYEHFHGA